MLWFTCAVAAWRLAAAQQPAATAGPPPCAPTSWYLWRANISLPAGSVVKKTKRTDDPGYGVDVCIHSEGETTTVEASIWDDDGAGFFEVSLGNAFCKVDVSSDGLGPGLQVMIFEQKGLDCAVSGAGGPKDYSVAMRAVHHADGSADCAEKSDIEKPCHPAWRPGAEIRSPLATPSWAIWTATITVPEGSVVQKTARGGDPGYGVDLDVQQGGTVVARVWDNDGDGFFRVVHGSASCKVDVGSDGLGPGLRIMIYEQKGMDCQIKGSGGPTDYDVSLTAAYDSSGSFDCTEKTETEKPCHPPWRPAGQVAAAAFQVWFAPQPAWTSRLYLPKGSVARKVEREGSHGRGVDLRVRGTLVAVKAQEKDGHAFLEVKMGSDSCKLDIGTNGHFLEIQVYEQKGLQCAASGAVVRGVYLLEAGDGIPAVII